MRILSLILFVTWNLFFNVSMAETRAVVPPEFLTAAGDYVSARPTCRDRIHVETDLRSGLLSIESWSSNPSLCYYRPHFYTLYPEASGTYIFKFDPRENGYKLVESSNENDQADIFVFSDGIQLHWRLGGYAGGALIQYKIGVKYRKIR